jgi:hypothetical protein
LNIDELIATAQPRTEKVRICARGDLVARHQEAVVALGAATEGDDSLAGSPATREAAGAVVAIEAEMEAATVTFTVASVSRQRWADLLAAHPPSKEERRAGQDHDPKRFPVAVVAACTKDPAMTVEQAGQLAGVLPSGEWNKLWLAILGLNVTGIPAPKLLAATELLQANGTSSTTPLDEGSPEDGSLAGSGAQ